MPNDKARAQALERVRAAADHLQACLDAVHRDDLLAAIVQRDQATQPGLYLVCALREPFERSAQPRLVDVQRLIGVQEEAPSRFRLPAWLLRPGHLG